MGQRVDEESDEPLDLRSLSVGRRGPHYHVVLTRQTAKHGRPSGQERHEQRRAVTSAQRLQPFGQLRIQFDRNRSPRMILSCRTNMVGREIQQFRHTRQCLFPVVPLLPKDLPVHPFPLPDGIVRVVDIQRRKWIRIPTNEGPVQYAQLVNQHAQGPPIGNDVVHGQEKDVVIGGKTDQPSTEQGPLRQVERGMCLEGHQPAKLGFGFGVSHQIVMTETKSRFRSGDSLNGPAIDRLEGGA